MCCFYTNFEISVWIYLYRKYYCAAFTNRCEIMVQIYTYCLNYFFTHTLSKWWLNLHIMCKLLCWFKAKCVISASLTDIAKIVFLFYVKCVIDGYEFTLLSRKFTFVAVWEFFRHNPVFLWKPPLFHMHSIQWKFGWNSKNFGTYRNEERSPVLAIMPIMCIWISYWHFLSIDTATMMGNFPSQIYEK